MEWRNESHQKKFWLLAIPLVAIPLTLMGAVWKVRDLQKPVTVKLAQQTIQSRVIFERINTEALQHPYASEILVEWSQPWKEESGLDLFTSESLRRKRGDRTLFYSVDSYGWVYSHADISGFDVLSQAHLQNHPITLPPAVHAQLRARGWTLTEHYLP